MTDELIKVPIKLYFPVAKVLSEKQHDTMFYKELTCTVEVAHFGNKYSNLREQGLVKHMRLIMIQDMSTLEWVTFKNQDKKVIREIQNALCSELCEKLQLRPQKIDPLRIVPREILVT
jgi:hypothetical protein